MRVLLVEDESKVAEALREGLHDEGYDVSVERTGEAAFFRTVTESFDIVLLDLGLPGRDGLQVMAAIRRQLPAVPIIVLTARDTVADRAAGLDAGADDYLVKPFAFAELVARIRDLLRRHQPAELHQFTVGTLSLDTVTRRVTLGGKSIELTFREFELLEYFMRRAGEIVSREALARDVWKETNRLTPLDNVIDVHMARLRRKLERDGATNTIHTLRGAGFVLREREP